MSCYPALHVELLNTKLAVKDMGEENTDFLCLFVCFNKMFVFITNFCISKAIVG